MNRVRVLLALFMVFLVAITFSPVDIHITPDGLYFTYRQMAASSLTRQVGASNDDCVINKSLQTISTTGNACPSGRNNADMYIGVGLRFTNISIPQGATITYAYLNITSKNSLSTTTVNTKISAEDIDNASGFGSDTYATLMARHGNHTTAIVNYDSIEAFTAESMYVSVNISTVIHEVVNRGGWSSGNAIVIFWEDFDERSTASGAYRDGYSYDGDSGKAMRLHIEWTAPCSPDAFVSPTSWTVGDVVENQYYSTGLGYFNVTNNSSGGPIDITVSAGNMTGVGGTWVISNNGTPGNMIYGLYAGLCSGSYNITVKGTPPYNTLVSGLANNGWQCFGLRLYTPTNITTGGNLTANVTLTIVCS